MERMNIILASQSGAEASEENIVSAMAFYAITQIHNSSEYIQSTTQKSTIV